MHMHTQGRSYNRTAHSYRPSVSYLTHSALCCNILFSRLFTLFFYWNENATHLNATVNAADRPTTVCIATSTKAHMRTATVTQILPLQYFPQQRKFISLNFQQTCAGIAVVAAVVFCGCGSCIIDLFLINLIGAKAEAAQTAIFEQVDELSGANAALELFSEHICSVLWRLLAYGKWGRLLCSIACKLNWKLK